MLGDGKVWEEVWGSVGEEWKSVLGCRGGSGVTRGAPWLLFNFFLLKKMDGPYRRTQGGHGAMAPPLALALSIPIRVVNILDLDVSFFDKKTSLK